ncbi:MAG: serine/threonine protein kinase [Planctomycetes bacterium]|nr:serine/threonine protein kinase [Planctomycetota bacterium]
MSAHFLCMQGHHWEYQEHELAQAIFCPNCGLRLYTESQAANLPTRGPQFAPSDLTPMSNADVWRLNRSSADVAIPAPTIQAHDIEAIPGYELLGVLGRGGMGIVFRARQLSLKRQVALKMILTGRHARRAERARFQREAESVARLQHPNIVQIYEVGEQNGLPYCALEFVNAGSLAQFLANRPQDARVSAQFVQVLAEAIHYAHKRGIVHRDLKPANILLQLDESQILKDGQAADTTIFNHLTSYVPKISDFGLAMHMGIEEGLYRHGAVVGTPSYMAPEQARGTSAEVGPAADVYALGAILYEMLTGRPPFKAATLEETAQQVIHLDPFAPTQIQPSIPNDLETICLVCLQKNPAHRYGSAEALADDLRRFVAGEPILARRTHLPERVVKWAYRRPLLAGFAVGGLAALSLFWAIWWDRAVTFQTENDRMHEACQKSEDQLVHAISAIDDITDQPGDARPTLLKARQFYEQMLEHDGPPSRMALGYYRLGRVNERLGDAAAARIAYQEAITRWEKLAEDGKDRPESSRLLRDARDRAKALAVR